MPIPNLSGVSARTLRRMAKKIAAKHPELKKLYAEQNLSDEDLDNIEEELTEGVQEIFNHGMTPTDLKSKDNIPKNEEQDDE